MRFMRRKQKVLVTIYDHAVHSFLMLMQSRVDVLGNSKHYHSRSKCLTILDRGVHELVMFLVRELNYISQL